MTTVQERAKALVDGVAAKNDPRKISSEMLGLLIAKEARRVAPNDTEFLNAVVDYMQHLASMSCGPGADHDCIWHGRKEKS